MSVKKRVKQRDDGRCVKCNAKPTNDTTLHAHHIVPESLGGATTMENLASLCSWCHHFAPDDVTPTVDYDAFFEEFCRSGLRPEMDLLVFGWQSSAQSNIPPEVVEQIESMLYFVQQFTTGESDGSDAGLHYPSNFWLIGAVIADYGDVRNLVSSGQGVEMEMKLPYILERMSSSQSI